MTPTIDYKKEAEEIFGNLYNHYCRYRIGETFYVEDDIELYGSEGITGSALIEGCIDYLNERTGRYDTQFSMRVLDGQYVDDDENVHPIDLVRLNDEMEKLSVDTSRAYD